MSVEKKQICKDIILEEVKQRGCCSWHGGVADGTYSPSCTCVVPINPLG